MKANIEILAGLNKLKRKYELERNMGKASGYRRGIDALRAIKTPFKSV